MRASDQLTPTSRREREATMVAAFLAATGERPDALAFVVDEERRTHGEALAAATACLRALRALGCRRGDHIGLFLHNRIEYIDLLFGAMLGGIVPVTLNARYQAHELPYVLAHSDVRVLFVDSGTDPDVSLLPRLERALPDLPGAHAGAAHRPLQLDDAPDLERVVTIGPGGGYLTYGQFLAQGEGADDARVAPDPEDIALMMYTSGTTARPKAALLSHRCIMSNAHGTVERWALGPEDRFWDPLPFFHMSTILPMAMCLLARCPFYGTAHFDADRAVDLLRDEGMTVGFPSFPTVMNQIIHHPRFDGATLKLRLIENVAPPDTLRKFQQALPGAKQVSAYGLTEGGGVVAFGAADDPEELRVTTSGQPLPGVELRVVDPDTGERLPPNRNGLIEIAGPCLFAGYYKDPDRTAAVMTPDGWLRTGDRGLLTEDGFIRYLGREKDMLKVGGENVAALEIESFLNTHPDVVLSQIVGVPDERLTEVPVAFVERRPGAGLTGEDVVAFCAGRLASFKVPRYVVFVDAWPMSATKIQKFRLREMPLGPKLAG